MKEITIQLSQSAKKHFTALMKANPLSQGIWIALEKAGCAGYMYKTELIHVKPQDVYEVMVDALTFFVPQSSLNRLNGLSIDCINDGRLETKLAFSNPNVSAACGCGESVELKDSTNV